MTKTCLFIGIIAGNFLHQFIGPHDYLAAFERSYFMGLALLGVWMTDKLSFSFKSEQGKQT